MPGPGIGEFLRGIANGDAAATRAALASAPELVNERGPHPFWGGRPQPLHVAIENGRDEIVEILLDAGADVNGTNGDYDHWSPLMLAVHRDRIHVRDRLIARGARIGLVEALMLADDEVVAHLLDSEGLPAVVPNRGSLLAFARTPSAIDKLVALGAALDQRDRWGATPADVLSRDPERGRGLIAHLVSVGASVTPAHSALLGDQAELERLSALNPADVTTNAVMMGAVSGGHHALVRWLLERGANPRARAETGARQTALHAAAWNGDVEMVRVLLEAGADARARDAEHNETPAGWAETSAEVTHNPRCLEAASILRSMES